MKNMKRWKRLLAVGMCSAMMFSMSVGVSATENQDAVESAGDIQEAEESVLDEQPEDETETNDGSAEETDVLADNETDIMPSVQSTVINYVSGGKAEIPASMGNGEHKAGYVQVDVVDENGGLLYFSGSELINSDAVYDEENGVINFSFKKGSEIVSISKGDYRVRVIFKKTVADNNTIYTSTDDVKVHVEMDSKALSCKSAVITSDGSEDIVYKFENGTGLLEWTYIHYINIFYGEEDAVSLSKGEFDYDFDKGTLTIKKRSIEKYADLWKEAAEQMGNVPLQMEICGQTAHSGIDYAGKNVWKFRYGYVENLEENNVISKERMQELVEINKEKDIVIETVSGVSYTFKKGSFKLIDGKDEYNFGVELITDFSKSGIKNEKVDAGDFAERVNYVYSGELPGTARICIPVDSRWNGKTLYYYQIMADGTLKDTGESNIVENGMYEVTQTHCSDYVLLSKSPKELGIATDGGNNSQIPSDGDNAQSPSGNGDPKDSANNNDAQFTPVNSKATAPKTADNSMVLLYVVLCISACVTGVFAIRRRVR